MKFQLLIALTIASPFWLSLPVSAQGLSCHKQIQATIANIAKLKLSLYLESARGNGETSIEVWRKKAIQ